LSGKVEEKTVTVSWMGGNVFKSLKGTIALVGGDGKAKSINWAQRSYFSIDNVSFRRNSDHIDN